MSKIHDTYEMYDTPRWHLIRYEGFKTHFVPPVLLDATLADLVERGGRTLVLNERADVASCDKAGSILTDRRWWDIKFTDGLALSLPYSDVIEFIASLETAESRTAHNQTFYKLHGWMHVIVLTPTQRAEFLAVVAENRIDIFRAALVENTRINETRKSLSAHPALIIDSISPASPQDN